MVINLIESRHTVGHHLCIDAQTWGGGKVSLQDQGCQHCDIERRETPNFIALCACVWACYEKKEHTWLVYTGKKRFTQKSGDSQEIGRVGNPARLGTIPCNSMWVGLCLHQGNLLAHSLYQFVHNSIST